MRIRMFVTGTLGLLMWTAAPSMAQSVPSCKGGNVEVGLFGGESYGLDSFRPMGGGNVAYGLNCAFFPFAEGSYLPGILRTVDIPTGSTTSYAQFRVNMIDFHAGMHIRLPRPESRVLPYALIGLGLIHGASSSATTYNVGAFGVAPFTRELPSSTSLAVSFGGGLRFFFNERFALRMEFAGFKPTSAPVSAEHLSVFYRLAIGPVFQFR